MFLIHNLNQFVHKPRPPHLLAAMRMIWYLKTSLGQGLVFPSHRSFHVRAYRDSNWATCCTTNQLSISNFVVIHW